MQFMLATHFWKPEDHLVDIKASLLKLLNEEYVKTKWIVENIKIEVCG